MTAWVWRGIGARCFQPHHVDAPPSIEPETSLCCLHHHLNCCTRRPIESTLPSWSGAGRTGGRSLARASPLAAGEPASATLPLQAQLAVALPQIQFASVAEMPRKGASLLSTAAQPSQSPADGVANSRSCASTTPSSTRSATCLLQKRPPAACNTPEAAGRAVCSSITAGRYVQQSRARRVAHGYKVFSVKGLE
jgi:hypothetical protein